MGKMKKKGPKKLSGVAKVELEADVANASLFGDRRNYKKKVKRNTRGLPDGVLPILQPRPLIPLTPKAQKFLDSFEAFPEAPADMHFSGFRLAKRSKLTQIESAVSKQKPAQDSAVQVQFNDHLANLSVIETLKNLEDTVRKKREVFKELCFKNSLLKARLEEKKTIVVWPAIFKECEDLKDQLVDTPMPDIPDDLEDNHPNDENEMDIEKEGESNEAGLNDSELIEPQFHVVVREVSEDGANAENGDVEPEVENLLPHQPFEVILDDLEDDEIIEEDAEQEVVGQDAIKQDFVEQQVDEGNFVGQVFVVQEDVEREVEGDEFVEREVVGQEFVESEVVGQEFVERVLAHEFVEPEVVGQEFVEQEVTEQQVIEEGGYVKYEEIEIGNVEPQEPNESDKDLTSL